MNFPKTLLILLVFLGTASIIQAFELAYEDHHEAGPADYAYWRNCFKDWYLGATGQFSFHDDHEFRDSVGRDVRDYCPGFGAGLTLGRKFCQCWYLEFEWMFRRHSLSKRRDPSTGVVNEANGHNEDVTYMVNLLGTIPTLNPFNFYFGGGVGASVHAMELSEVGGVGVTGPTTSRSTQFAFQLMGGIVTYINKHLEAFAGYRFFATSRIRRPADPVKSKDLPIAHSLDIGIRIVL